MVSEVHAVLLAGGSAFGLDAAAGVMRTLEARGVGYDVGMTRVPIVPGAVLFDLGTGRADVRPDAAAGARAVEVAAEGPIARGTVGAGTGAAVGRWGGSGLTTKGGVGSASAELPDGHVVGALLAVNAMGDVYDPATGKVIAGARNPAGSGWLAEASASGEGGGAPSDAGGPGPDGGRGSGWPGARGGVSPEVRPGTQTTIGVVATDLPLSKAEARRLAMMAHDGLALAIRPTHTPMDGDVIFALSLARPEARAAALGGIGPLAMAVLGAAAAGVVARAAVDAVRSATALHGVPAARDIRDSQ
jgi:L-aminopeptidase/D-esterase-like protein